MKIIANTVWENAVQVTPTDSTPAVTTDKAGVLCVTGGPRHLSWTQSGTAERSIWYANTAGNLSCDSVVITRAEKHVGHQIQILSSDDFLTTTATEYDSGSDFDPTLVGKNSRDWVKTDLDISDAEGIAVRLMDGDAGSYTRTLHQVYFGTALDLEDLKQVQTAPLRRKTRHNTEEGQTYVVTERATLRFEGVTSTNIDTFETLYRLREEPVFLYDEDGYWLDDNLWHCVIESNPIEKTFDDHHSLELRVLRLAEGV